MDPYFPIRQGRVIALSGAPGCGKSALAEMLVDSGWQAVKFAGPLKAMLRGYYREAGLHEWEITDRLEGHLKEEPDALLGGQTPRWAMQTLGTEWGRSLIDSSIWVDAWRRRVRTYMAAGFDVVTDDLRFANELAAVRDVGGISIEITRPNPSRQSSSHASEARPFECDELIVNDGTISDLREALWNILEASEG